MKKQKIENNKKQLSINFDRIVVVDNEVSFSNLKFQECKIFSIQEGALRIKKNKERELIDYVIKNTKCF